MADLIPVTFNEGEPLDPKKLNDLRLNITNTYQTAAALQNATSSGNQTLLMDAGTLPAVKIGTANTAVTIDLPVHAKFGGNIPFYIVSIGSEVYSKDIVSVGVKDQQTAKPKAVINASVAGRSYIVNYIAFLLQ